MNLEFAAVGRNVPDLSVSLRPQRNHAQLRRQQQGSLRLAVDKHLERLRSS